MTDMTRHIALLRGINVGGHRKVPMADLRALVASLGYTGVASYIQSGNLAFSTTAEESSIVAGLETAIEQSFGFAVPVIVRTADEMRAVAASHPLVDAVAHPRRAMVAFLDRTPTADSGAVIDADEYLPDRFALSGREVYLDYPDGSARAKLTHSLLERTLDVRATIRNWNTVTKLVELGAA
jgi:uncharacterized protein (DUF1697 family)